MSDYYNESKIGTDTCAIGVREETNKYINDYNTFNYFGGCGKDVVSHSLENRNLTFRNGYGTASACTIDKDSEMRFACIGHGPERQQLSSRQFIAVPNMGRGIAIPDVESALLLAEDTGLGNTCGKYNEKSYDRFVPLTDCMKNYIDGYAMRNYFPVGVDSREETRKNLRNC